MTPRRLDPHPLEKPWGTKRHEPWFANPKKETGEIWFKGVEGLPLLVKFLFTSQKLSVQVHPDDAYAKKHHDSLGKTEMWHILAAEPGAKVAAGFKEPLTRVQLKEAALSGEIVDRLQWFDAAPGDTFFIPARTVHAIGEGLTLCEIQQNSDITYRLYDYGRPRELQIEQALDVSNLGQHDARQKARGDTLVSCDYFKTERLRIDGSLNYQPPKDRFEMLIVIEGSAQIAGQNTKAGDAWYIPGGAPAFEMKGDGVLLRTSIA